MTRDKPSHECLCSRCGVPCRMQFPLRPDAQLLKRSSVPTGHCANCAVTAFLTNTFPCNMIIHQSPHGPRTLLLTAIQQQFVAIMQAGRADMRAEEIDWSMVVRQWDLPVEVCLTARNPWLPHDSQPRPSPSLEEQTRQREAMVAELKRIGLGFVWDGEDDVVLRRGTPEQDS